MAAAAAAAAALDGAERSGRRRARHLTRGGHVSGTAAPERKARDDTAPAYWLPGLIAARELHRPECIATSASFHWLPFPSPPCREAR